MSFCRLLLLSTLLLCFSSSAFADIPPGPSPSPTPPPVPVRPVPVKAAATAKAVKAKVQSPKYRFVEVKIGIQLQNDRSIRTRSYKFSTFRFRKRVKILKMKNGVVALNLKVEYSSPGKLSIAGTLTIGGKSKPILIKGKLHPQQRWSVIDRTTLLPADVTINISAEMFKIYAKLQKSNFNLDFKNFSLYRMIKKVAEFNNLKASIAPNVPNTTNITLKLGASTQRKLINNMCAKYKITCNVSGKTLHVIKK